MLAGKQNINTGSNKPLGEKGHFFQCKLTINDPHDPYEQEADAVADKVMRMETPSIQAKPLSVSGLQRKCAHCEEEEKNMQRKEMSSEQTATGQVLENYAGNADSGGALAHSVHRKCAHCEDEEKKLQRKEKNEEETGADESLENYVGGLSGSGQPLPNDLRNFYEPRFGYDFSNVRLHTNTAAAKSADSINAHAYTSENNIVFNQGKYMPGTESGKQLLAHELTHVIQQKRGSIRARKIQRQHIRLNSGRFVGDTASRPLNLKEDVLEVMDSLHTLWSMSNANYGTEYPAVRALPAMSAVPIGTIPHTITSIRNNEQPTLNNQVALNAFGITISAPVGTGGTNRRTDIYALQDFLQTRRLLSTSNHTTERAAVTAGPDPVNTSTIPNTLSALSSLKIAKVAEGYRPHDILRGTRALNAIERGRVESILIPGASVSGTGTVSPPTPDAICTTAGLETEIRTTVVPYIRTSAATFRTRQASPPVLPMAQIRSMGDIVEAEIEGYFGPYLRGATSVTGARYTFGQYQVRSEIRNQAITTQWQNPGGREGWVKYWISTQTGNTHHCNQSDLDRVAHNIATDAALTGDIDNTVNGWPAEATGGIHINPYLRNATANVTEQRRARWDAFTIILHEAIHHLAHPNFVNTYNQMNNDSMQILKEGFNDLFRRELWFGAGRLKNRIATSAYSANRNVIEGGSYTYIPSVVTYHADYPQVADAQRIEAIIGNTNAKAAYFLGHTEYLGLGAGSGGLKPGGSFTNIASYHPTDPGETNRVATLPGETYAQLRTRINARPGTILTLAGNPVATTGALPATVRVSGVRHITVIAGDTLSSIAYQNGVTPGDITRANALPSSALTIGQRLLIPIH